MRRCSKPLRAKLLRPWPGATAGAFVFGEKLVWRRVYEIRGRAENSVENRRAAMKV
jgi:hypothetical protein